MAGEDGVERKVEIGNFHMVLHRGGGSNGSVLIGQENIRFFLSLDGLYDFSSEY
jgi:hypothetical protein